MSAKQPHRKLRRALKIGGLLVVILIILVALFIALIPQISHWAIVHNLEQQGYRATVSKIDVDLFNGRLTGKGIKANKAGQKLAMSNISLVFDWQTLRHKKLSLLNLQVRGLRLDVTGDAQQDTAPAEKAAPQDSTANTQPDWWLGLAQITLEDNQVCWSRAENTRCLNIDKIQWQGNARLDLGHWSETLLKLPFSMDANLSVSGLDYGAVKQPSLVSLQQLDIDKLQISTLENIQANVVSLKQLVVPRPPGDRSQETNADFVRFESLSANQVSVNKLAQAALDELTIKGLGMNLVREQDGRWQVVQYLQQQLPATGKSASTHKGKPQSQIEKSPLLSFKLGKLALLNSRPMHFVDYTLDTPFSISLQELAVSATHFNTDKPQQKSLFELDTQIGQHGRLQLKGELQPFHEALFFNINGDLNGIDLRPATAYLERYLGHRVQSGQISGSLNLSATEGKLDGVADVELQHFNLQVADEEQANVVAQQLGTPLMASLTLLREGDKSIHLKIPVSGDINDPQFNTDDAVRKVLARAINEAVKNYYIDYGLAMAGVGQYSLAVKGASKLFEFLTRLRFEPVKFESGQFELNPRQKAYLDALSEMLRQRPEVHLTLCGFATQADRPEQNNAPDPPSEAQMEALLQLANLRASAVKDYLVEQQSVAAKRLIVCEGQFDAQKDQAPRVEISI